MASITHRAILAALAVNACFGDTWCVGWRQTLNCDPSGERQPDADKECSAPISTFDSGYCECENGRRAMEKDCRSSEQYWTCEEACSGKASIVADCQHWQETDDCNPAGAKLAQKDCAYLLNVEHSGYCSCSVNGLLAATAEKGCGATPNRDCAHACLKTFVNGSSVPTPSPPTPSPPTPSPQQRWIRDWSHMTCGCMQLDDNNLGVYTTRSQCEQRECGKAVPTPVPTPTSHHPSHAGPKVIAFTAAGLLAAGLVAAVLVALKLRSRSRHQGIESKGGEVVEMEQLGTSLGTPFVPAPVVGGAACL